MAGIAFGDTLWKTTIQERIPQDVIARVSSYDWLVSFVFMPIGFVAFGPIAKAVGVSTTLIAAGIAIGVANLAVAMLPPVRAIVSERGTTPRLRLRRRRAAGRRAAA
jgi:hypothetical protein